MDIRELIMSTGMSARPGAYAGRGVSYSDLNADILNKIADLIRKHYGDKAHDNYVKMVWQIDSLTATAFLNNLYTLERHDWDLPAIEINNRNDIIESHDECFGLIAATIATGSRSKESDKFASDGIRNGFRKVL
jgi:hypothetical protein